jgi:Phosphatidylserine decarboxylase
MEIKIFDREKNTFYIEKQFREKELTFLYGNFLGRTLLNSLVKRRWFSNLYSLTNKSRKSVAKIEPFINEYKIDMSDYKQQDYLSFNSFFTRKIAADKRPITQMENMLISPADAKLSVYPINEQLTLNIKNSSYSVNSLLQDEKLSSEFKNGLCLVFRLTVDDYHRYCFFDNGKVIQQKTILGSLHTVGPISAQKYHVYSENNREYVVVETENFSKVIQMEVGALLVGKIVNYEVSSITKGMEKGYFEFGGSTIILLFKEDTVKIDSDIMKCSDESIEVRVKFGEKIGEKI